MTTPAYLLSCTPHMPVTGDDVVSTFLAVIDNHGAPASTLTDNGRVYTAHFGGGRNAFEHLLPRLGARQKNGSPGHPQTQGKTDASTRPCSAGSKPDHPPARAPNSNANSTSSKATTTLRPHRALARRTPGHATAPRPRPPRPPTDTPPATTACATTDSTTTAA